MSTQPPAHGLFATQSPFLAAVLISESEAWFLPFPINQKLPQQSKLQCQRLTPNNEVVQLYLRGQNSFCKAKIYGWKYSWSEMILPANIQTFPTINVIAFNYHTSSFMKLAKIQVSFEVIIVLYVFISLASKCFLVKLCLFYYPALKISFSIASSVLSIFSISYSMHLSLGSSFLFSHSVLVLTLQYSSRNL